MRSKLFVAKNVNDLSAIANEMLCELKEERIFAFKGKMGAGKTTFIKEICRQLGVEEVVSSPTFALINVYSTSHGDNIYHFDFYRIKKIEEVFDIGYEEYFYSNSFCLIEWPELITEILPEKYVLVSIAAEEEGNRNITFEKVSR